MEQIEDLIHKLVDQQKQGATASELLGTVQKLYSVLQPQQPKPSVTGPGGVAVILPLGGWRTSYEVKQSTAIEVANEAEDKEPEEAVAIEEVLPPQAPIAEESLPAQPYSLRRPEEVIATPPQPVPEGLKTLFEASEDVPTLRSAPVQKELHEMLGSNQESLNDKLKLNKTELAQALKNEPIKDLRKGIGVNDKFLFINELFRGDEAMYERSIKTINAFHILPEAEYWINRELKVKLGWSDTKDTVQHFYGVVRRRFS